MKKRLLIFIEEYHPIFSGHGVYLKALLPRLKQRGYDVYILTCSDGSLPEKEVIDGIQVQRIIVDPCRKRYQLDLSLKLLKVMLARRREYDIFQFSGHVDRYGFLVTAAKLLGKSIIMQMVLLGSDDPASIYRNHKLMYFRIKFLKWIDKILYISNQLYDACIEFGFDKKKLHYVRQGVDTDRFAQVSDDERQHLKTKFGIDIDKKVVVFVGAIIYRKGVDILLDAWSRFQEKNQGWALLLVGPSQFSPQSVEALYVEKMKKIVGDKRLDVVFTGKQTNVHEYMQIADIFTLPSRKEGFGNVIIEAMATNVPCVVSEMDGVSLETVRHGDTGYIFNSAEELAEYLDMLAVDDEARLNMGVRAGESARGRFAFDKIIEDYINIYET